VIRTRRTYESGNSGRQEGILRWTRLTGDDPRRDVVPVLAPLLEDRRGPSRHERARKDAAKRTHLSPWEGEGSRPRPPSDIGVHREPRRAKAIRIDQSIPITRPNRSLLTRTSVLCSNTCIRIRRRRVSTIELEDIAGRT